MAKKITTYRAKGFFELNWEPGEIIGLDNPDSKSPLPFILSIPQKIYPGFKESEKGLRFHFITSDKNIEDWTLVAEGELMGLLTPEYSYKTSLHNRPHFVRLPYGLPDGEIYTATHAYSGEKNVRRALMLEGRRGLDVYAKMLGDELNFEGGLARKIMEISGLSKFLPPTLRFKNLKY